MMAEINYDELDPGIRSTVRLLNKHGFVTTESGDGISKPPDARTFDCMHVVCRVDAPSQLISETDRLSELLGPNWQVQGSFSSNDRTCLIIAMLTCY